MKKKKAEEKVQDTTSQLTTKKTSSDLDSDLDDEAIRTPPDDTEIEPEHTPPRAFGAKDSDSEDGGAGPARKSTRKKKRSIKLEYTNEGLQKTPRTPAPKKHQKTAALSERQVGQDKIIAGYAFIGTQQGPSTATRDQCVDFYKSMCERGDTRCVLFIPPKKRGGGADNTIGLGVLFLRMAVLDQKPYFVLLDPKTEEDVRFRFDSLRYVYAYGVMVSKKINEGVIDVSGGIDYFRCYLRSISTGEWMTGKSIPETTVSLLLSCGLEKELVESYTNRADSKSAKRIADEVFKALQVGDVGKQVPHDILRRKLRQMVPF
jgi:hypothetical protein